MEGYSCFKRSMPSRQYRTRSQRPRAVCSPDPYPSPRGSREEAGLAWRSTGPPRERWGWGLGRKFPLKSFLPGFGLPGAWTPAHPLQCGNPTPALSPSSSGAFLLPACPRPWMGPSSLRPQASSHAKFGTLSPPTLCPRVTRSLMEPPWSPGATASCPTRTRAEGKEAGAPGGDSRALSTELRGGNSTVRVCARRHQVMHLSFWGRRLPSSYSLSSLLTTAWPDTLLPLGLNLPIRSA